MEPPNPSFANEPNVPQQVTVLVFDELRAADSLPFHVHRLDVLMEAGLVAFPDTVFEFVGVGLEEAQHSSLANIFQVFLSAFFASFRRRSFSGLARRLFLAPLSVAMFRSYQPARQGPRTNPVVRVGA